MSAQNYTQAMRYEMFIRNAFNCPRGNRNGADLNFMNNTMTMEDGETFAKHLGSFEKQFEKVQNYISKALIKLSKTKPYSKESNFFNLLNKELEFCSTTKDLMEIVDNAVNKMHLLNEK